MKALYETTIINTGGRDGYVYSPDNIFNLDVAKPAALGGNVTTATNPESYLLQATVHALTVHLSYSWKRGKLLFKQ